MHATGPTWSRTSLRLGFFLLLAALAACDTPEKKKEEEPPRIWPHELEALPPVPQQPRDPNRVVAFVDADDKTVGVYGQRNTCIIQASRLYCSPIGYTHLLDEHGLEWGFTGSRYYPADEDSARVFQHYVTAEADCSGARFIEEPPLGRTFTMTDQPGKVFARTPASTCQNVTVSGTIPFEGRCDAVASPTEKCVYPLAALQVSMPQVRSPVHIEPRVLAAIQLPDCGEGATPWASKPWCDLAYDAENWLVGTGLDVSHQGDEWLAKDDAGYTWVLKPEGPRPVTVVDAVYAFTMPDCMGEAYLQVPADGSIFQVGPGNGRRAFVATPGAGVDIKARSRWVDGDCEELEVAVPYPGVWPLSALQEVAPPDWTGPFQVRGRG